MALPELNFEKKWTASQGDGKYLPTIEDDEGQARQDLQIQHDNTKDWADALVAAIAFASNLGTNDDYGSIGSNVNNVKEALDELKEQIEAARSGQLVAYQVQHSHLETTEHGGAGSEPVHTDNIKNGAITSAKLSSKAAGREGVAAVDTGNIANNAVTSSELASDSNGVNGAVMANNINNQQIHARHIKDGEVSHLKLGGEAVETDNIKDKNVTDAKLADNAVTADKLSASAVAKAVAGSRIIKKNVSISPPTVGDITHSGEMGTITVDPVLFGTAYPQPGEQSRTYTFSNSDTTATAEGTGSSGNVIVVTVGHRDRLLMAFPTGKGTKTFTRNDGNTAWVCGSESYANSDEINAVYGVFYTYSSGSVKKGHTIKLTVEYAWLENSILADVSAAGISYTVVSDPRGESVPAHFTVPFNMNDWTKPAWYNATEVSKTGISTLTINKDKFTRIYKSVGNYTFTYEKTLFSKVFDGSGITGVTVDESTFLSQVPAAGKTVFTCTSVTAGVSLWSPVLATYGITFTGTAAVGNTITVTTEHLFTNNSVRVTLNDIGVTPVVTQVASTTAFTVGVTYTQPQSEGDYPFRGTFQDNDIAEEDQLAVYFSQTDVESGEYSPYCDSYKNTTVDTTTEVATTKGYGCVYAAGLPGSMLVLPAVRIQK